ncbi:hypothetical protein J3E71DRAFT_346225 [Bipolaris maydis]|nr:hypothetical protein J3E71DRAFT_346225 [Bipolaris maydis]
MTTYTVTHASAIIRYIPGGAFSHTVTRFLNITQQELCYAVYERSTKSACPYYVNCVFEQVDEYAKVGIGSGTQLLSLIPAALAFLPSSGPDVDTVIAMEDGPIMRTAVLLLGAYCGLFPTGRGFKRVGSIVPRKAPTEYEAVVNERSGYQAHSVTMTRPTLPNAESVETILVRWDSLRRNGMQTPSFSLAMRWTCIIVSILLGLVIVYASLVLGFLGVVTWACDRQLLVLSWVFVRMAPTLLEAISLSVLRRWLLHIDLRSSKRSNKTTENAATSRVFRNILSAMEVFVRALHGAIAIYGIAVLGSTTLVDGIPAMMLLMLVPALYGAMGLCILGAVRE